MTITVNKNISAILTSILTDSDVPVQYYKDIHGNVVGLLGPDGTVYPVGTSTVKPTNYLYVGKNGNDTIGDGSAGAPFLTIGAALTAATSGTTLFVWPGNYAENVTFKANVNITAPSKFSTYISGNHVSNFIGTVVVENVVFQSSSGNTVSFAGTGIQNLQLLGSDITSTTGDAVNWTNNNASSKFQLLDGNLSVFTSGTSARAFYSSTTSAGAFIANRSTIKVDNYDHVAISANGAISFTHTSDAVNGQIVVTNTATVTSALCTHMTATVPVLNTTSTGLTTFLDCIDISTATPIVTGTGGFAYAASVIGSTGKGSASTLNGGIGSIILDMAPIKFRSGTVRAVPLDGVMEYDGTNLYFTVGSTRKTFTLV